MFKYLFYAFAVLLPYVSLAQTPEQLEMMRSLGIEDIPVADKDTSSLDFYKTENIKEPSLDTGEKEIVSKDDPNEKLVPLADLSVYDKPDEQMTLAERNQRTKDVLQGRITVMMKNLNVYKTAGGHDVCTVDVELNNASGKTLNDLYIVYAWGPSETFVHFSGVKPFTKSVFGMGAADEYCSSFYQEQSKNTITSCKINGLSFDDCKNRIIIF